MPLIDNDKVERVEFETEEGKDWYDLRVEVGFFEERIGFTGEYTISEAYANKDQAGKDRYLAGEFVARQQVTELLIRIKAWSHPDEINIENVKRIPPYQASELLDRIERFELQARPFRREPETNQSDNNGAEVVNNIQSK